MKKIFCYSVFLAIAWSNIIAQPVELENKFLYRAHTGHGYTIPYRLFIPENYDPSISYPIVFALHGYGECGTDNITQIHTHRIATAWADSANQSRYPCFILAPQGPPDIGWYDDNVMTNVYEILDSIIGAFSIDINRQYITGLSMGGWMTWMTISRFPDRFAAAIPMSGWEDDPDVSMIKHVAIWNVHGQTDGSVPIADSRELIDGFQMFGRQALYTNMKYRKAINFSTRALDAQINSHVDLVYSELGGVGHDDGAWATYYNNPLLTKWVFNQYRMDTLAIKLSNFNSYHEIQETDTIKWESIYTQDTVEIWFSPDNGYRWDLISATEPNDGLFIWDLSGTEDCVFGLVKINLKDSANHVFGADISENFAIDNSANGKPYLQIIGGEIMVSQSLASDTVNLYFQLGDPDDDSLDMKLYYSADAGTSYKLFDSMKVGTSPQYYDKQVFVNTLEYSTRAYIKVGVSDGQYVVFDSTQWFRNSNGIISSMISQSEINNRSVQSCYPNPTSGLITISFDKTPVRKATIFIYNLQGTQVFSKTFENTTHAFIDLLGYPAGIYIVKVLTDGGNYTDKIIKE